MAERKHCHILETARTLLHDVSLPHSLWLHAVLTAIFLINRLPSPNTKHLSPYQILHNRSPDYTHLRVFGCACYPHLHPSARNKLETRSTPYTFIGYSTSSKGYLCFNSTTGHIITSHNLTFDEHTFPFKSTSPPGPYLPLPRSPPAPIPTSPFLLLPTTVHQSSHHTDLLPITPLSATLPSSTSSPNIRPLPSLSSSSQIIPPVPSPIALTHPMLTRAQIGHLKPKCIFDLIYHQLSPATPTSYSHAIKQPEWRQAMSEEFHALQAQGTWTLIPLPSSHPIIGYRWTYRLKLHADGSIARYKAHLVAQGHKQEYYGINYTETFSLVAKFPIIHIFLTVAISHKWSITQLDVSNTFLHGQVLHDTIYMSQPPDFQDSSHPTNVRLLKKALYIWP